MNCADNDNYNICNQLGVESYPHIKHFEPGQMEGTKFNGWERNYNGISLWIDKRCYSLLEPQPIES